MEFVSIITSAHNESSNVPVFIDKVFSCFERNNIQGEVILINDGSTDDTTDKLKPYQEKYSSLKVIKKNTREGLTRAINTGFDAASGNILVLLPSDMESDPESDIPDLLTELRKGFDAVVGWRQNRGDGKVVSSAIYNYVCRKLFNLTLHDMNWIKAIRREKIEGLRLQSDWHRYLVPILASRGSRIGEVKTDWHPRKHGKSKFGFKRFFISLWDLISLLKILRASKKVEG